MGFLSVRRRLSGSAFSEKSAPLHLLMPCEKKIWTPWSSAHDAKAGADAALEKKLRANPDLVLKPLQRWPKLLLGMIQLNANDVKTSLDALNRWLRDGPMRGVYFTGSGPGAVACSHRNMIPLVERIASLGGVIMQHTWFKTGGKTGPEQSTPAELAQLAAKLQEQEFHCAHEGGE